jgi:hypothetical protein
MGLQFFIWFSDELLYLPFSQPVKGSGAFSLAESLRPIGSLLWKALWERN